MKLHITNKFRYVLIAVFTAAALAGGTFYTASLLRSQNIPTYQSQGAEYARSYVSADDKVFMKVNDYEVNYREYAEMKRQFANNLRNMQAQVNGAVPLDDWMEPVGDERYQPSRPLPQFMITDGFKALTAVMEKHGVEAGALGAVIIDYARYSQAVEDGFTVTDDALAEEIRETRAAYESNTISS